MQYIKNKWCFNFYFHGSSHQSYFELFDYPVCRNYGCGVNNTSWVWGYFPVSMV